MLVSQTKSGITTVPPIVILALLTACGDDPAAPGTPGGGLAFGGGASCQLPTSLVAAGGPPPDGIPALVTPEMVEPIDEAAAYLRDDDRVLGLVIDGKARAYPHNILWWHEIVNDTLGGRSIAVTYCPLTGSGLVFDKGSMGGPGLDLGVSGLLFANNLMMYDRSTSRLVGPQMSVVGRCGDFAGLEPELIGVTETTWGRWLDLHPGSLVVSGDTGHDRNYRRYPYGGYDRLHDESLLFPMAIDRSRPPKELVLGVRTGDDRGVGYPFGELAELGPDGVVNDEVDGRPIAVFFEAGEDAAAGTAVAFDRRVDGMTLTFQRTEDGIRDVETGTRWAMTGRALTSPLVGHHLEIVDEAYVAFWFAWMHFQPDSRIFEAS